MGTVAGVYVVENRHVVVGQTLVDLDPHDLKVALKGAQADFARPSGRGAESPSVPFHHLEHKRGQASAARAELAEARRPEWRSGGATAERGGGRLRQVEAPMRRRRRISRATRNWSAKTRSRAEEYDQRVASAEAAQAADG